MGPHSPQLEWNCMEAEGTEVDREANVEQEDRQKKQNKTNIENVESEE